MKSEQIYRERLLRLADFLDTVPDERFDFGVWAGQDWGGKADLSCGTVACALGWATALPEFQALGMRLARAGDGNIAVTTSRAKPIATWIASVEAADAVFGLDDDEVEHQFTPTDDEEEDLDDDDYGSDGRLSSDAGPRDVAEHIRRFLEKVSS